MKLGSFERFYVNGWLRHGLHQPWVLRWFLRQTSPLPQSEVLEIGCGAGYGVRMLLQKTKPYHITGLDYDSAQLRVAEHTLKEITATQPQRLTLKQGDATKLPFADNSFHAVFSFGAIHHVPQWRHAVQELARCVKSGGTVYLEEYYRPFLHFPLIRWLLPHPNQRFSEAELILALQEEGLHIAAKRTLLPGITGLVVAKKP